MKTRHSLIVAAALLAAATSLAQPAVGYNEPDDISTLLDYRLPDWGWRHWDGEFQFRGDGRERGDQSSSNNHLDLNSHLNWVREGENLNWSLRTQSYLDWSSFSDSFDVADDSTVTRDTDSFSTRHQIEGRYRRYIGDSAFFAGGGASVEWGYNQSNRDGDVVVERRSFGRTYDYGGQMELGVGRVRNVSPLIMAQRVSRRLVALGRPGLSRTQVMRVAEALVRRPGYDGAHERPDRLFWESVLEPVLDPARPLSPYEVAYIQDVERESLFSRYQGLRFSLSGGWSETRSISDSSYDGGFRSEEVNRHEWRARSELDWSHNLSLVTQIRVAAAAEYEWGSGVDDRDEGYARAFVAWLREIADRHRLQAMLHVQGNYWEYEDGPIRRVLRTTLRVSDRYWLEDRLALVPSVEFSHIAYSRSIGEAADPADEWRYSLAVEYVFSTGVF